MWSLGLMAYPKWGIAVVTGAYSALGARHGADGSKAFRRPMTPSPTHPTAPGSRIRFAATTLALALIVRIVSVMQSGAVEPLVAMRTYLFWAIVCVPVALLGDLLLRTIWNYEVSQLTRSRIRARRRGR